MVRVEQSCTEEPRANEQEGRLLLAVETDESETGDHQGYRCADEFPDDVAGRVVLEREEPDDTGRAEQPKKEQPIDIGRPLLGRFLGGVARPGRTLGRASRVSERCRS